MGQLADSFRVLIDSQKQKALTAREIAAASIEQADGVEQINQSLAQIEQVTHSITAAAEQSSSVSEALSNQSADLKMMLSRFKMNDETAGSNTSPKRMLTDNRQKLIQG